MIYITGISALQYWLNGTGIDYPIHPIYCSYDISDKKKLSKDDYLKIKLFANSNNIQYPVHIMIPYETKHQPFDQLMLHTYKNLLPEGSFIILTDSICMASPELCFVQANAYLPLPLAITLGNDLCGIYVYDGNCEFKHRQRHQLTDSRSVCSYIEQLEMIAGIKLARKTGRFILDGSNSPMESKLATAIVLPLSYGGYALPRPTLNEKITLSAQGMKILNKSCCLCDFSWIQNKLAMEYDSNQTHLTPGQHMLDKNRTNALVSSGFSVISITYSDWNNLNMMDKLMDMARKKLGLRSRRAELDKYYNVRLNTMRTLRNNNSFITDNPLRPF